jgi:BTB/POZ domain-containing protein KCTD9
MKFFVLAVLILLTLTVEGCSMSASRISYEDSCRRLQPGYLETGAIPPLLNRLPQPEEEKLGVSFFRTFVGEGEDLSNLTLPRTFFGRSEINDALFKNTDLTESNLRWNDFIDVDFTGAVLAGSDLRASSFTRVKFIASDLRNADMRRSTFEQCDFTNALMAGAILTRAQGEHLKLSFKQRAEIAWTSSDGEEPSGG